MTIFLGRIDAFIFVEENNTTYLYFSYGRYGSVLMGKELASFKSIMKSFMVLIVTALAMGETLALAPDLLKGNQMVASVFELLDRQTEVKGDVGEELTTVQGTIELKKVHFSYPSRPDVVIFKDLDLKVPAGKCMALVGQSGSGKSSVVSLILRFYDPTSGKVMIDGKFLYLARKRGKKFLQTPPIFTSFKMFFILQ